MICGASAAPHGASVDVSFGALVPVDEGLLPRAVVWDVLVSEISVIFNDKYVYLWLLFEYILTYGNNNIHVFQCL